MEFNSTILFIVSKSNITNIFIGDIFFTEGIQAFCKSVLKIS